MEAYAQDTALDHVDGEMLVVPQTAVVRRLDVDADLFKDRIGIVFKDRQICVAQDRIGRDVARYIGFTRACD